MRALRNQTDNVLNPFKDRKPSESFFFYDYHHKKKDKAIINLCNL